MGFLAYGVSSIRGFKHMCVPLSLEMYRLRFFIVFFFSSKSRRVTSVLEFGDCFLYFLISLDDV